jgi:heat shock protein HslJ
MKNLLLTFVLLFISQAIFAQNDNISLFVANHYGEIKTVSLGTAKCYLVKESTTSEWQNFNGLIEGFKYKEGYDYELLVEKVQAVNPPADLPTYNYKLKSVVSKKPTMIISSHNKKLLTSSKYILKKMRIDSKLKPISNDKMIISFQLINNTVSGNDGCNDFSGRTEINKNKISFSNLGWTKKFCPDANLDNTFNALFKDVDSYKISNKYLKFYKGKKLLLEYRIVN